MKKSHNSQPIFVYLLAALVWIHTSRQFLFGASVQVSRESPRVLDFRYTECMTKLLTKLLTKLMKKSQNSQPIFVYFLAALVWIHTSRQFLFGPSVQVSRESPRVLDFRYTECMTKLLTKLLISTIRIASKHLQR